MLHFATASGFPDSPHHSFLTHTASLFSNSLHHFSPTHRTELEHAHEVRLASLHVTDLQSVTPPRLGSVNLWTTNNIARFDETWVEEVNESTSSSWLVSETHAPLDLV